jgi:NitT/TauT family transport system substrate-binding protein
MNDRPSAPRFLAQALPARRHWRSRLIAAAIVAIAGGFHAAGASERVVYLLPAPIYLPAFGPWIVARERGYYSAEGLEVQFETARGGADVAKQIGVGNAVIGGAMGDTPIIVRGNGVPVRSVAVLGGHGLMQLVVHADSDIKDPADLKGKTVNVTAFQETTFYATLGMLAAVGLTKADVNIQATGPANIWKFFLARKADAMAGVPDFIAEAENQGAQIRVIPSSKYFDSMGQAILASDQTIRERPALVRSLVRATLRGMQDVINDPAAAAATYVRAVPDRRGQEKQVQRVFELYKQYVYGGQRIAGEMNRDQLARLQAFYVKEGISQSAQPVDDLFTNDFVK